MRGQPSQHLSAHYQLECDYGTRLISIYKEGDPVFLCEDHRTAIRQSDDNSIAGVRSISVESIDSNDAPKNGDRTNAPQPVEVKPDAPAPKPSALTPSEPVSSAAARVRREKALKPSAPASKPSSPSDAVGSVAAKVKRETVEQSLKEPVRDLTYGDGTKALVDETIWNMAPGDLEAYNAAVRQGKTAAEAAHAAGGQLAIVHRKIGEYTLKIEAVLSKSRAVISVDDAIDKPLERAMLEIIGNSAISDTEKDNAIDHLGAFQEQLNRGLNREMTPLQAHRIARFVGNGANWGATSSLSEELKPAYRAVYTSVRNGVRAAVPQAHDLDGRLANLYAAKSDLENAPPANASCALPVRAATPVYIQRLI